MSGCGCAHTEAKVEQMLSNKRAKFSESEYNELWSMIGDDRVAPETAVNRMLKRKMELGGSTETHICDEIAQTNSIPVMINHLRDEHTMASKTIEQIEADIRKGKKDGKKEVLELWEKELKSHFAEEEQVVFGKLVSSIPMYAEYLKALIADHRLLEKWVFQMQSGIANRIIPLHFCIALKEHISNENHLFKIAERKTFAKGGPIRYKTDPIEPILVHEDEKTEAQSQTERIRLLKEKSASMKQAKSTLGKEDKTKRYVREIGLSLKNLIGLENKKITNSRDAYEIFREIWNDPLLSVQEQFYALFLDRNNNVIGYDDISKGGTSATVVDSKIIVGIATKALASAVIMAHNHPSGNTKPSQVDMEITKKIKGALALVDINLIDHLVIVPEKGNYHSIADNDGL
jgi:DNA repair protein RadC